MAREYTQCRLLKWKDSLMPIYLIMWEKVFSFENDYLSSLITDKYLPMMTFWNVELCAVFVVKFLWSCSSAIKWRARFPPCLSDASLSTLIWVRLLPGEVLFMAAMHVWKNIYSAWPIRVSHPSNPQWRWFPSLAWVALKIYTQYFCGCATLKMCLGDFMTLTKRFASFADCMSYTVSGA